MINIKSNGSKFLGERPDTIEDLLIRLQTNTLDPRFSPFIYNTTEGVRFAGNFFDLSGVFDIVIEGEPDIEARLRGAIRANVASPSFSLALDCIRLGRSDGSRFRAEQVERRRSNYLGRLI